MVTGTEAERAIDISNLRQQTGYITLDDGYGNTGSCRSRITFIDGEKGILRYRGIPIEELAETVHLRRSGAPADHGQAAERSRVAALSRSCSRRTSCCTRT